jgi:3-deoxy-D-manno-octulosonic-acid transferase
MSKSLYKLGNFFYFAAIKVASAWSTKAKSWVQGRKNWKDELLDFCNNNTSPIIWMHSASLGEFEQGRPLIENIKKQYPNYKFVVTFFSPSGYNIQKNYEHADYVCYLPINSKSNAHFFIETLQPNMVLWIKYDYWSNFLIALKNKKIPTYLVSATFREQQPFFNWYGGYWVKLLQQFTHCFVQNEKSKSLLKSINIESTVTGDTRFDRVNTIAKEHYENKIVAHFIGTKKCIIAGSSWSEDEEEFCHFANKNKDVVFIVAPHHINEDRLSQIEALMPNAVRYSQYNYTENELCNVLIIDNIGMLSYLYRYATVCIIGGGFGGDGLHNTLEAAVYGKPLLYGPAYDKHKEAVDLIDLEAAFEVENAIDFEEILNELLHNEALYQKACNAAKNYVIKNTGSDQKIIKLIMQNGVLPDS